jgi:hypothetical protein
MINIIVYNGLQICVMRNLSMINMSLPLTLRKRITPSCSLARFLRFFCCCFAWNCAAVTNSAEAQGLRPYPEQSPTESRTYRHLIDQRCYLYPRSKLLVKTSKPFFFQSNITICGQLSSSARKALELWTLTSPSLELRITGRCILRCSSINCARVSSLKAVTARSAK